jgi:signal transduction histidine kinase/AraC-like DNA-binding protein
MMAAYNDELLELRDDALSLLLLLTLGGLLALFVSSLLVVVINRSPWQPWPYLLVLSSIIAGDYLRRRRLIVPGALVYIAGLISGPIYLLWSNGSETLPFMVLIIPVIVSGMLLSGTTTFWVAGLISVLVSGISIAAHPQLTLESLEQTLALVALPCGLYLFVAVIMYTNANTILSMIGNAIDSQRKDAHRAELFYKQQEQLRKALFELEMVNNQLNEMNMELSEARRVAETANRMKTQFLANISHELRTPLHIILGVSEASLMVPNSYGATLPAALRRDFGHVHQSAEHLSRLIDDLLDLSRAEIDALDLFPETLDPSVFLQQTFQSLADRVGANSPVVWQSQLPQRLPLIQADSVRLRQIVLNLLSNAAKFTSRGSISLAADVVPPYLHIWVADTGCGIPLELQEHIFEPFVTGVQNNGQRSGVGLGLSITRRLVELHQGVLTLESKPEQGTTVHLYLPLPNVDGQAAVLPQGQPPVYLLLSARNQIAAEISALSRRRNVPLKRIDGPHSLASVLHNHAPIGLIWDLGQIRSEDWQVIEAVRRHPQLSLIPLLLYRQQQEPLPDLAQGITNVMVKPISEKALIASVQAVHPANEEGVILVVDDDSRARELYQRVLASALPRCEVQLAENGAVALALLQQTVPRFVILDLMMPEVDGFTLLSAIRANPATRQTPVLVLSGRMLSREDILQLDYAKVTVHSKGTLSPSELTTQLHTLLAGQHPLAQQTSSLVKRAISYMHEHYQHPFNRQELAAEIGVNERYLTKIFHDELGFSPRDYLARLRIIQAKRLLRSSDTSISDIALAVGFDDPSYFGRVFRLLTGFTPKAYREQAPPNDAILSEQVL